MHASTSHPPRLLSIAGSDSGGGAGIQADLKAFARCGAHGMTAITAITAQSTVGVSAVHPVPADVIVEQVRAVAEDIGVDAVKVGMLGTAETIEAVDAALDLVGSAPVVIDPVMVAESGAVLLDDDARQGLRSKLLPRAAVVNAQPRRGGRSGRGSARHPARRAGPCRPRARARGGGGHGRPSRRGHRHLLRWPPARGDPRRAPPGRRGARIGLHPLVGPRRPPGPRARPAGGGAMRQGGRRRGRPPGPARHRSRAGARRRAGHRRRPAGSARGLWHNRPSGAASDPASAEWSSCA